ncbi:hypothetical protein TW95_gp1570 [Pandoravirus inopinatum]|uniref:Uncharacterized protein n=1 Tax=Pandoravirus inopinatum TaxID=1605721 RepID=A0A0B5J3X4_9VIRU|nr:hypothetical protein TW95_gp1570 [Pandoravirus inopinatum]AJF98304.1 hypothetical protein [Pandoravirus inopinatum]
MPQRRRLPTLLRRCGRPSQRHRGAARRTGPTATGAAPVAHPRRQRQRHNGLRRLGGSVQRLRAKVGLGGCASGRLCARPGAQPVAQPVHGRGAPTAALCRVPAPAQARAAAGGALHQEEWMIVKKVQQARWCRHGHHVGGVHRTPACSRASAASAAPRSATRSATPGAQARKLLPGRPPRVRPGLPDHL